MLLFCLRFSLQVRLNKTCTNRWECCTDILTKTIFNFTKNTAANLKANSFFTAGSSILSTIYGFGSGFVCKSDKGKLFIVTNYHVVEDAQFANFEVINGKDTFKYNNLKVIKTLKDNDLALIEAPTSFPATDHLTFFDEKIADGDEVYTAGYPALADMPSWQFGKGIVSNNSVFEAFYDSIKVRVVQHTAQVDPGSSGGPLLIKSGKQYKVAGVNTFKARNRENTNFAVSADDILAFLNSDVDQNDKIKNQDINKTFQRFVSDINSSAIDTTFDDYISEKFVLGLSKEQTTKLLSEPSEKAVSYLRTGYALPGLKLLVCRYFVKAVNGNGKLTVGQINSNGQSASAILLKGDNQFTTYWSKGYNGWFVDSTSVSLKAQAPKSKCLINSDDLLDFSYVKLSKCYTGFDIRYAYYHRYVNFGLEFQYGNLDVDSYNYDSTSCETINCKSIFGGPFIALQFPFEIKQTFAIVPYVQFCYGGHYVSTDNDELSDFNFTYYIKAGLHVGYITNNGNMIYLLAEYNDFNFDYSDYSIDKINGFSVGLGFTF